MKENMTSLMCAFIKEYHYNNNGYKILSDSFFKKLLTKEEYDNISASLSSNISFFNNSYVGSDPLKWIMINQLSPSVLGRSIYCEKALKNAYRLGCRQYAIYASGYDTSAYNKSNSNMKIFEIDKESVINDKIKRLDMNNIKHDYVQYIKCNFLDKNWINNITNSIYDKNKITFNSLLGISYYLEKDVFEELISNISKICPKGSTIVFDYQNCDPSYETDKNEKLAKGANEEMKAKYRSIEIETLLSKYGFLVYEHMNNKDITSYCFDTYNSLNNDKLECPKGICFCLAVKQ